ncbi:MAG: anti-sigma regulatory factor [Anaerolineae bacterium]|nr:anti-sigma regulatory factor [Anaerolineae bacterium]
MSQPPERYPLHLWIVEENHPLVAAWQARMLARRLHFSLADQTALATAVLEVARNIVRYAGRGEVIIRPYDDGVEVVARDAGPGIASVELALTDGYSTGHSLGLGLPGAKRLMSTFEIETAPGAGTLITMRKFPRAR